MRRTIQRTFQFATLDGALVGSDRNSLRDRVEAADPSGIGFETARVMAGVHDTRAKYGGNIVRYDRNDKDSLRLARSQASTQVRSNSLPDGSELGDIYVDTAASQAQWNAYNIVAARMLEAAEFLDDVPSEACNIGHIAEQMRGDARMGDSFWMWEDVMGRELAGQVTGAVMKDMGLTLAEAEKLSAKYDALVAKREKGFKQLGWTPGECVADYLKKNGIPEREFDRQLPQTAQ